MKSLIKRYGREKRLGYTGLNYCCKLQLTSKHSPQRRLMEFLTLTQTLRFVAFLGCKWSIHWELLFHSLTVFLYIFSYEKIKWVEIRRTWSLDNRAGGRTMLPENDCLTSHALGVKSGEVFCRSETIHYSEHERIRPPIKRKSAYWIPPKWLAATCCPSTESSAVHVQTSIRNLC
jgi:hypothetical protein